LLETCDAFEAALLRAGKNEAPREGGKERTLVAVGGAALGSAGLAASWKIGALGWKWFSVGLFVIAGGTIAVRVATVRSPLATLAGPQAETLAPAPATGADVAIATPAPSPKERVAEESSGSPPKARALAIVPMKREPTPSTLAEELALVRQAKAEIARGDARAALATTDRYDRAFPKGALAEEAEVVRVDALVTAREYGRAAERGWFFLERHPGSPYAERVRALVRKLPLEPK
jgi:hypothetical protein